MASTNLRRALQDASLDEVRKRLNALIDVVRGNLAGWIKLHGDDGTRIDARGGSTATGEYALDVKAASGLHVLVTHSSGTPVILAATDSGNVTANAVNSGNVGVTGNLTFVGTVRRLLADFSNATISNRTLVKTSTTNGETRLGAIPDGTATKAGFAAYSSSAPDNSHYVELLANATDNTVDVVSSKAGTGTTRAMRWLFDTTRRAGLSTAGVFDAAAVVAGGTALAGSETLRSVGASQFDGAATFASTVTLPAIDPPTVDGQATAASQCKAFAYVTAGGGATLGTNYNVASVTRNLAGDFTVAWDRDFANATYALLVTVEDNSLTLIAKVNSQAAGSADVYFLSTAGTKTDPDAFSVLAFGSLS